MHPVLFNIGSFPIATYGLMIVVGMLVGIWLAGLLGRRIGLPREFFYDLTFVLLVSGFLGARLAFILTNWNDFLDHPFELLFSRGGFVFLGGFITAGLAAIWFVRRRGLPLLTVADVMAAPLLLAHAFGRIGCFLAGCCYGEFCLPGEPLTGLKHLAVQFPLIYNKNGVPSDLFNFAYHSQIQRNLIPPDALLPLPLVPIQLFEAAGNFLICLILILAWKRRRFSGLLISLYLILYSSLRFLLEFKRGDVERGLYLHDSISTSQIISIFTFLIGVGILLWRRKKGIEPIALPIPAGTQPRAEKRARSERKKSAGTPLHRKSGSS